MSFGDHHSNVSLLAVSNDNDDVLQCNQYYASQTTPESPSSSAIVKQHRIFEWDLIIKYLMIFIGWIYFIFTIHGQISLPGHEPSTGSKEKFLYTPENGVLMDMHQEEMHYAPSYGMSGDPAAITAAIIADRLEYTRIRTLIIITHNHLSRATAAPTLTASINPTTSIRNYIERVTVQHSKLSLPLFLFIPNNK